MEGRGSSDLPETPAAPASSYTFFQVSAHGSGVSGDRVYKVWKIS